MTTRTKKMTIAGVILLASVLYGYTTLQRELPWKDGVFYDVSSEVLTMVYYRADTGTLTLGFRRGAAYEYNSVPVTVFHGLMDTDRKGTYYNQRIRGKFPARRLELSAPGETI